MTVDADIIAAAQAQADALAALNRTGAYPFDSLDYEAQARCLVTTLENIVRRWTKNSPNSRHIAKAAYEHHINTADPIAECLSKGARHYASEVYEG